MAWDKCEDCNGTGVVETESVFMSRTYNKNGRLVVDIVGRGDWKKTQCPCVGEEEYLESEHVGRIAKS